MATPDAQERELTFGEKAVGFNFNPGGSDAVRHIKRQYADIIDDLNDERNKAFAEGDKEKGRHLAVAITDAETAQMRAVKGLTWGSN